MFFLTHNNLRLSHHRFSLINDTVKPTSLLRLVQLSDLHFYEHTDTIFYDRVMAMVYRAAHDAEKLGIPCCVCITGDTIHQGPSYVEMAGTWLSKLPKPVIAVLGNHDYEDGSRSQAMQKMFVEIGVKILINDAIPMSSLFPSLPDTSVWMVGLDDYYAGIREVKPAFVQVPDTASVIALAHNPLDWNILKAADLGAKLPQLVLSGHTHAGHVFIPWLKPIYQYVFQHQYRYGWYQQDATSTTPASRLYVTSGVGSAAFYPKLFGKPYPLPPFRFNTWPEVAVMDVSFGV